MQSGFENRYLVTGGLGFIGSHLARSLAVVAGASVLVIDNRSGSYEEDVYRRRAADLRLLGVEIAELDILDTESLDARIAEFKPVIAFHLAARPSIFASLEDPERSMRVNATGTANVLDALAAAGSVERVAIASSSSVCAGNQSLPVNEIPAEACLPISPYGKSKLAAEMIAAEWHERTGIETALARLFNVYGPDGRRDMLPFIVARAATQGNLLKLRGWDECRRDWTHVEDTVAGLIAIGHSNRLAPFETVNIGRGSPTSLADFVIHFRRISGLELAVQMVARGAYEPAVTWSDSRRLIEGLGVVPRIRFDEGLAEFWNWFSRTQITEPARTPELV